MLILVVGLIAVFLPFLILLAPLLVWFIVPLIALMGIAQIVQLAKRRHLVARRHLLAH